ncbi:MAG TPA: SRPBCC family protein [Vicinamibacterales bacterium]|nr:SRPBCC family protein [Vicinamibacterales bacterium]
MDAVAALGVLVAWLVLPVLIAWFLTSLKDQPGDDLAAAQGRRQRALFILIALVSVASVAFRIMTTRRLEQTAVLFIGVPALLALAAVFIPARSAVGVACKSVTIGLLVSLIFLGEGILCVVMAAPLYFGVAVLIGAMVESSRKRQHHQRLYSSIALLVFVPMTFEGVFPATTINRNTEVTESAIVNASAAAVAVAVVSTPRFNRMLPGALTLGLPRPLSVAGDGEILRIEMRGGETRVNGREPRTGTLVLAREHQTNRSVTWRAVSDDSHMRHFLSWQASVVEWEAIDEDRTRVTWTIRYRRDLDPAWYFGPMERFAVRLAARYLIESVATP